ncbi:hypothetical protein GALMADRAFT_242406 [Galerina marginata CBS 339.88]|uniref:RING-type domain-containing protein n=1 Tax=Galerina marginata (strain CBS 339.88) TaxID=685588 RepID=A0A067TCR3_GALM3|nr:hypothetical protein GALMADRAFT_242406 [Galerina marginata CBS 339.88]
MSDVGRGIPLLSGPVASPNSSHADIACRKCSKEFNMIFARARKCNHCGYSYCHSCSDYQALMPRNGPETGYDPMHVCSYCIEFLTITAAGRQQLKAMSLAKLKKYIAAYNIKIDRAVEKDDLIDAIIGARGPNGCLPRANETFYRTYSVPNKVQPGRQRGLFSRQEQGPSANPPPAPPRSGPTPEFARPDLEPDNPPPLEPLPQSTYPPRPPPHQTQQQQYNPPPHPPPQSQQQYNPPPHPPPQQQYNPPPNPPPRPHSAYANAPPHNPPPQFHTPPPRPPQAGPPNYQGPPRSQAPPPLPHHSRPPPPAAPQPQYQPRPPPPRPATTRPTTTRPPTQAPQPPQVPRPRAVSTPAPPTLEQLLNMTQAAIGSLSVGALKSILFTNHVNPGQVLEKGDLVKKVLTLVEVEKSDRERQRQVEQREEMERIQREAERQQELENQRAAERERAAAAAAPDVDMGASQDAQSRERSTEDDTHEPRAHPSSSPPKPAPMPPKTQGSASTLERTGLCVICQDEEANIAIIDCGHMAMCRGCSDLVMASSRECPLCRTRVVTEARLLRIFKT